MVPDQARDGQGRADVELRGRARARGAPVHRRPRVAPGVRREAHRAARGAAPRAVEGHGRSGRLHRHASSRHRRARGADRTADRQVEGEPEPTASRPGRSGRGSGGGGRGLCRDDGRPGPPVRGPVAASVATGVRLGLLNIPRGRGLYQLQLNFSEDTAIHVETTVEYRPAASSGSWRWSRGSQAEFPIYDLLHTEIESFTIREGDRLELRFTNAGEVAIIPDGDGEAYQIMHGSTYIVV